MNNLLTDTAQPVTLRVPDFKRVALTLVGCGGTGSHIASGLASIALALQEQGVGVDMLFIDPDRVEPKNVGRQLFTSGDVGQAKAEVLAERLNAAYGLRIGAAVRRIDSLDIESSAQNTNYRDGILFVVVGAVDNAAARAVMASAVKRSGGRLWWLDCGNENHSGQVCIGNTAEKRAMRGSVALGMVDRLPAPSVVYPDLVSSPHPSSPVRKKRRQGRGESCAELTAAGEQSLMINRMMAGWACSMLHDFVVTRDQLYLGVAVDLAWGGMRTYTIDAPTIAEACGLAADEVMVKAKKG
jgi:PRTRC genetic system ThiF family protein